MFVAACTTSVSGGAQPGTTLLVSPATRPSTRSDGKVHLIGVKGQYPRCREGWEGLL